MMKTKNDVDVVSGYGFADEFDFSGDASKMSIRDWENFTVSG